MADMVKWLTHLTVNQACVSSILIIRPRLFNRDILDIAFFINPMKKSRPIGS